MTEAGAVCVSPFAGGSFLLHQDGTTMPAHDWPHPVVNELPWHHGDGFAAWGWPRGQSGPGYVMYRKTRDAPVLLQELPFRPGWGTWFRDRLYWTCHVSGIGSWAPGEGPALALAEQTFLAIDVQEGGLLLSPGALDSAGGLVRRRQSQAWRWDGDGLPAAVPLGPLGTATSRSVGPDGWGAFAYPEADLVRLESAAGRPFSMTCYHPLRVAWLERSLLVSTFPGELLLFPDLIDALGR